MRIRVGGTGRIGRLGRPVRVRRQKVNKYLLYKNTKRLQNLVKVNRFLNLFLTLAWLPLVFSIIVVLVYPVVYVLLYTLLIIVTLGLILLDANNKFKFNDELYSAGILIGIISVIAVIALHVTKKVILLRYQRAELAELQKEPIPEENKKYIDIYDALKRTSKAWLPSFIILIVGIVTMVGLHSLSVFEDVTQNTLNWIIAIFAITFLISYIIFRIRANRIYISVEPQVNEIREERRINRQANQSHK